MNIDEQPTSKRAKALAKIYQGYVDAAPTCKSCANYRSTLTERPALFTFSKPYFEESNRHCGIGGFAVKANGYCRHFAAKSV